MHSLVRTPYIPAGCSTPETQAKPQLLPVQKGSHFNTVPDGAENLSFARAFSVQFPLSWQDHHVPSISRENRNNFSSNFSLRLSEKLQELQKVPLVLHLLLPLGVLIT